MWDKGPRCRICCYNLNQMPLSAASLKISQLWLCSQPSWWPASRPSISKTNKPSSSHSKSLALQLTYLTASKRDVSFTVVAITSMRVSMTKPKGTALQQWSLGYAAAETEKGQSSTVALLYFKNKAHQFPKKWGRFFHGFKTRPEMPQHNSPKDLGKKGKCSTCIQEHHSLLPLPA